MPLLPTTLTLLGAIQKFFTKAMMDRPQEDFRTPLVNAGWMDSITIPKNGGQYGEWRKFSRIAIKTESGNSSPYTYTSTADIDEADMNSLTATVSQVPLEVLRIGVAINNIASATDPINLITKSEEEMRLAIRRLLHRVTNDRMVRVAAQNVLTGMSGPTLSTYVPFKTAYVGGVSSFANLKKSNVYTMDDFRRGVALLSNIGIPPAEDGLYVAVINAPVKEQLFEDAAFRDIVKRHEDMAKKTYGKHILADWAGCRFVVQDDGYRCNLAEVGGALATRADTGAVHISHIFGQGSAAGMGVGGAYGTKPAFKVQDISRSGVETTVAATILFTAFPTDTRRGLNLAGCTNYDESIDDIPSV